MSTDEVVLADTDEEPAHSSDCWRIHQRCAIVRVVNLSRSLRIQQSALQVIAEFSQDPKVKLLARKSLLEARW